MTTDVEELARIALGCGYKLHREIGPGLLETVYEILLAEFLNERGLRVEQQKIVPIIFRGKNARRDLPYRSSG